MSLHLFSLIRSFGLVLSLSCALAVQAQNTDNKPHSLFYSPDMAKETGYIIATLKNGSVKIYTYMHEIKENLPQHQTGNYLWKDAVFVGEVIPADIVNFERKTVNVMRIEYYPVFKEKIQSLPVLQF